ncbi:VpaChn25_0724 family phage protein [Solimonas flava]|uniref:VpaChn25_0724 family phage protein n=1 Tax=Solimonas flava TaxID=415849 RepID=UPI000401A9EB|nr:hypothetical protein [Solimonas flava]
MSYRETFAEHVRLCILRLLSEAVGSYEANNSIIADAVCHFGLNASRDFVNTQLTWLDEQGLLKLRTVTPLLSVAKLTTRGFDVAAGRAHVPGVKHRGPGD